jgi:hypothetical protein
MGFPFRFYLPENDIRIIEDICQGTDNKNHIIFNMPQATHSHFLRDTVQVVVTLPMPATIAARVALDVPGTQAVCLFKAADFACWF